MTYRVAIEWVRDDDATVRLFRDDESDPIWTCDVAREGVSAVISRTIPCPPMDSYRSIIRALHAEGMDDVIYTNVRPSDAKA